MKYQFKVTVKELYSGEKEKWATFYYDDKFYVNSKCYGIGYSLTSKNDCDTVYKLEDGRKFKINNNSIFQFISQHSAEPLVIEVEEQVDENNVKCKIVGVTLRYE